MCGINIIVDLAVFIEFMLPPHATLPFQERATMEQRGGGERRNFSKEQVDVTDFYDRQKVLSFSERQQSRMVHGRNFHNWIKSVLIDKVITKISGPASVLDFCGGKGGDLLKWKSAGISQLVLVDISLNSVRVNIFKGSRSN